MTLFAETGKALQWVLLILRRFMRVVPGATMAVVACLTVARVTRLLAFLLPLKVILLAGSDGIPRYFRAFLSPEHREAGIVALSAAAILSYALTLLLEARSKRLSDSSGVDLLSAADVMSVVANQREEMQGIYVRFTQVVSAALFVTAGVLALAVLDPVLAGYVIGLALCFYLLTAWALHGVTSLKRNRLADVVDGRLSGYLGVLSSIAFLSGFLVILYPFLAGTGDNVLVAIICFVVLRQLLGALTGAIKDIVGLVQKRHLVDTLVLPDRQFQQVEGSGQRTLRELFGRQDRERLVAGEVAELRRPDQSVHVEWLDPPLRGMAEFSIALQGGGDADRHFRLRVFPSGLRRIVENEDLLFRHVPREMVWAPPVVKRFVHGGHTCIVYDTGAAGVVLSASALAARHSDFIASLWCVGLPPALVRIYSASHQAMHERLTDDLLARMEIALDTDAAAEALGRLRRALPSIRETIAGLPLCLINPAFTTGETVIGPDGVIQVLGGWGKWSLEPMGAGLPASFANGKKLAHLLAEVRRRQPGMVGEGVGAEHLMLARRCALLEREIQRGMMKSGMAIAAQILSDLQTIQDVAA